VVGATSKNPLGYLVFEKSFQYLRSEKSSTKVYQTCRKLIIRLVDPEN
jgi:hypothetical protein